MNFADFKQLVEDKQSAHPVWFGLESDRHASEQCISAAQEKLNALLPRQYTEFVTHYGGGYFALGLVYSLDPHSDFYIVDINRRAPDTANHYVLFSENGCGDFYGFKIAENRCLSAIFFLDHATGKWAPTQYQDLFSFLGTFALSNQ